MSLKDEFNIPKPTWDAMVRRGVISCSVVKQEEILSRFKIIKDSGTEHTEAVKKTAFDFSVSEEWVYRIIKRYQ